MAGGRHELSYYEMLEVGSNATDEEIEASYKRIVSYLESGSLAFYSMIDEQDATELRGQVDEAYHTLSDPARRAAYDRKSGSDDGNYPAVLVPEPESGSSVSVGRFEGALLANDVDAEAHLPLELRPEVLDAAPVDPEALLGIDSVSASAPAASSSPRQRPDYDEVTFPRDARESEQSESRGPRAGVGRPPPAIDPGEGGSRRRRFVPSLEIQATPDTEFSGALLRRLRESAGASLDDVADLTKIGKRYLRALEANDFDTLPAPVYVRGFVSEYARVLGLDPKLVSKSYLSLYQRYRGEGS